MYFESYNKNTNFNIFNNFLLLISFDFNSLLINDTFHFSSFVYFNFSTSLCYDHVVC